MGLQKLLHDMHHDLLQVRKRHPPFQTIGLGGTLHIHLRHLPEVFNKSQECELSKSSSEIQTTGRTNTRGHRDQGQPTSFTRCGTQRAYMGMFVCVHDVGPLPMGAYPATEGGGGGLGLCRAAVPPHRVCRVTRGRCCVVLCCAVLCCVVLCWNLPL